MTKKFNQKMHGYANQSKAFKTAMKRAERNATVQVDFIDETTLTYGVYLNYSGQSRLLYTPQSRLLYSFLEGPGARLGDLRRWQPGRGDKNRRLADLLNHVIAVADFELEELIEDSQWRRTAPRPAVQPAPVIAIPATDADLQPAA